MTKKLLLLICYCLSLLILFPSIYCTCQDFDKINLPPASSQNTIGGTMTYDILYANGFVFLYSFDRVLVYTFGSNSPCGSILFEEQVISGKHVEYGKFNPLAHNPRLYTGAINFMAFNPNKNIVYVVKPSLEIDMINVNQTSNHIFSNTDIVDTYDPFLDINIDDLDTASFRPMNGKNIIKFDDVHNRIYWVVISRNDSMCTPGNFHYRKRFLGLYSTDSEGYPTYHDHEVITAHEDYRGSAIADVAFNANNDFYYLVKLNQFEVHDFNVDTCIFGYPISGGNYFQQPASGEDAYYKFSKLLYINKPGVHLIVAFPYKYPSHIPLEGVESEFFTLDGNHSYSVDSSSFKSYPVPCHRITDGEFLSSNNDLLLSYAPDNELVTSHSGPGTHHDIAIVHYDTSANSFANYQVMSTNINEVPISSYDQNVSLKLTKTSNSDVLVSKKDELVLLSGYNGEYTVSQILENENLLLGKGVSLAGKSFISNPYKSGFEIIDTYNSPTSIKTGYPVYHIVADNDGDKLYFYNTLNTYGNGLYICDIDDQGSESISFLETDACIGDCKYNPYSDHFLVSENGDFGALPAKIMIIDNDAGNSVIDSITLPDSVQYPKEMFIGPNGRLYVFTDMIKGRSPKLLIYAAYSFDNYAAYDLIISHSISLLPTVNDFAYYSGNFCYFPYTQSVFASIHPTEATLNPYLSIQNSMFNIDPATDTYSGSLFKVNDTAIQSISGMYSFAGKMICPYKEGSSQYGSKMFVIGSKLLVLGTSLSIIQTIDTSFNDITYSPYHDQLYGLMDCKVGNNPSNRMAKIYEISPVGDSIWLSQNPIAEFPGQASSLFFNEYDNKLYLYQKYDEHKLGGKQVRLISFDPDQISTTLEETYLGLTCFYPELDHNNDFHYYLYNITTPYINPYNNTIYTPNGGHSCVSMVSYDANEALRLKDGAWSWVSFPRMDRSNNNPDSIPHVLGGNITPDGGNYIIQTGSELQHKNTERDLFSSYYDEAHGWNDPYQQSNLYVAQSTLGYKLYLKYDSIGQAQPNEKWLFLKGSLIHPDDATDTLVGDSINPIENWIGYYLPVTQSPFDAIDDDIKSELSIIKAQNWVCYNDDPVGDNVLWRCACNKGNIEMKYGDMVIIKTNNGVDVPDFKWQFLGNPVTKEDRQESEYYQFSETADYTPIFIELDSTENPIEIGAFVEDSCVGASTVEPDDSLLLISAYTEGLSGEIYFEEYYGSNKNFQPPVIEYYVKDSKTKQRKRRMIHTAENQDYYIVSFQNNDTYELSSPLNTPWIRCIPNPANENSQIKCFVPVDDHVEIILYDILGNRKMTIYSGMLSEGNHTHSFRDQSNLARGTYILSLKSANFATNSKIVLIK